MGAFSGQRIWIVGASSGIGESLAVALAEQGAELILSARRADRLKELQERLGSGHRVEPLDVADTKAVQSLAQSFQDQDIVVHRIIFMAAVYQPSAIATLDLEEVRKTIDVNLLGAIAVAQAGIKLLKSSVEKNPKEKGQLVICASVAGLLGLPHGQPYSATKAALINFTQSLYAEVGDEIDIKLINPGFVRTQLTAKNRFHMPMCLEPDQAAQYIVKDLQSKKFEIHFPKAFTFSIKTLAKLPDCMKLPVIKRLRP